MLALTALLAASTLVSAAPAAVHDRALPARGTLDDRALGAALATPMSERDSWENGWYNTRVMEALDCYSAPTYNSDKVSYYKPGSSVAIGCQTHGEEVDGNDVWDFTIRECYVPNVKLDIDHVWIPGMDECCAK